MRVAYLNADCGIPVFGAKGACVHIQEMVRAFEHCGADVRIVATRIGDARPAGFRTPTIQAIAPRHGELTAGTRRLKEERNAADALAVERRLIELASDWPFDMIYERYSLWSMAGVDTARRLRVPLILEVNSPLVLEQHAHRELVLDDLAGRIEQTCFSKADAILTVSQDLRDYVVSRSANPARVLVIGNAVDTRRFHPDLPPADFSLPAGAFVVGFSGSLKRWHGVDVLMEAFRIVRKEVPQAHLLVLGDGPKRGWIEGYAQGAGIADAVTVTGWVPHDALPGALCAMDVALAPYPVTENFYFSPLKLFEYLAAGRTIVASDIGQIASTISHDENGLLVPPGDAVRLAEAILALNADPERARRLAQAAAIEGAKHGWERNARIALSLAGDVRKAA